LPEEFAAAFPYRFSEIGLEVGKVQKRRGRRELLPLKEHRRARHQQKQRGHRAPATGARQLVAAQSAGRVGDLVVILKERDERRRLKSPARGAARSALPVVVLTLKQVAILGRRDELLRLAASVAVVRLRASGERDHRAVMKVVVPEAVEAVAPF